MEEDHYLTQNATPAPHRLEEDHDEHPHHHHQERANYLSSTVNDSPDSTSPTTAMEDMGEETDEEMDRTTFSVWSDMISLPFLSSAEAAQESILNDDVVRLVIETREKERIIRERELRRLKWVYRYRTRVRKEREIQAGLALLGVAAVASTELVTAEGLIEVESLFDTIDPSIGPIITAVAAVTVTILNRVRGKMKETSDELDQYNLFRRKEEQGSPQEADALSDHAVNMGFYDPEATNESSSASGRGISDAQHTTVNQDRWRPVTVAEVLNNKVFLTGTTFMLLLDQGGYYLSDELIMLQQGILRFLENVIAFGAPIEELYDGWFAPKIALEMSPEFQVLCDCAESVIIQGSF